MASTGTKSTLCPAYSLRDSITSASVLLCTAKGDKRKSLKRTTPTTASAGAESIRELSSLAVVSQLTRRREVEQTLN